MQIPTNTNSKNVNQEIDKALANLPKGKPHNLRSEWIVSDLDGNIEKHIAGRSLLEGFLGYMCCFFRGGTDATTVKDRLGTARAPAINVSGWTCSTTGTTRCLVVGSNNTPVALTDYAINTLISDGVGAGQLTYGTLTIDVNTTLDGSSVYWDQTRSVTNNSASTVNVEETAFYVRFNSSYDLCVDRSLLSFSVPVGITKVVTCRMVISV